MRISKHSNHTRLTNVLEGTQGYVLHQLAAKEDRSLIFITANNLRAKQIYEEFNFLSSSKALLLPEWDAAAYDLTSPSKTIMDDRISALSTMACSETKVVLITTAHAVLQKIIAKTELQKKIFKLKTNETVNRDHIIASLIESGYRRESSANEPGEFAVRGSIIDVMVPGQELGYRVSLAFNEIEYVKTFDPSTQITQSNLIEATIIPADELVISPSTIKTFNNYVAAHFGTNAAMACERLNLGVRPTGIEQWSTAFYANTNTIFDYIQNAVLVLDNFVENQISGIRSQIEEQYKSRLNETSSLFIPPLLPDELWLKPQELTDNLHKNHAVYCSISSADEESTPLPLSKIPNFRQEALLHKGTTFPEIKKFVSQQYKDKRNVVISCFTEGSRDRVAKILTDHELYTVSTSAIPSKFAPQINLIVAGFEHGFISPEYALITEEDIFGERVINTKAKRNPGFKNLLTESQNFSIGDLVVHKEYGIGRFEGLETVELSNTKHDCLKITYADNDKLFVPVENLELITRYGEGSDGVKLDRLGTAGWQVRKARIKERIQEAAKYLIETAAKRTCKKAEVIEPVHGLYDEFCASFGYVETEDQSRVISEVEADLSMGTPMDRLICGDVGFGKTEVALRAAFLTVKAGNKQVALICPTTILALQHFKLFTKRLSKFDVKVKQLSRLVSAKDASDVIKDLAEGKIDVLIGTHALLNDKVTFKNLSLLIVDEEQHFGVGQKEKLKKLKEDVHVLSMSATPIPRTLQMSLAGIRNLSLIATPPINRLVTKTSVIAFDSAIIREALLKEYFRGGQSFYICPRISDLAEAQLKLKELVPQLKIATAHGQMSPREIDKIMTGFYEGQIDVLLSTSIIESGLDIPKANTIIVYKSDKFGLSQLYQMRGRVGRSNVPAYAYFTLPMNKQTSQVALKRLEILQSIDQLGSSFMIAAHDMDMRGYGNLVGEVQSGHIKEVGVELYQSMLEESVKELRLADQSQQTAEPPPPVPQINLHTSVLIPESYVQDFDLRLSLYRRASELTDAHEVTALGAEMVDRFGSIPIEAEYLLSTIKLKLLCMKWRITKLDASPNGIVLSFAQDVNPDVPLQLINALKGLVKVRPDNKLLIQKAISNPTQRITYLEMLLHNPQE